MTSPELALAAIPLRRAHRSWGPKKIGCACSPGIVSIERWTSRRGRGRTLAVLPGAVLQTTLEITAAAEELSHIDEIAQLRSAEQRAQLVDEQLVRRIDQDGRCAQLGCPRRLCDRGRIAGSTVNVSISESAGLDDPVLLSFAPSVWYPLRVQASAFDELAMFRAIAASGTRALLIGRQALVALGMPVMTADYDFWIAADDAQQFNETLRVFELVPNRPPDEARRHGRYVLENDEHVDVLVAAAVSTVDGVMVRFEDVWERRSHVEIGDGVRAAIPCVDDLILTKRFGARPRDADDVRWLEELKRRP